MAERTRDAIKRQCVAVVESALANIDVVSHLGSFLAARDLCQVRATCKVLGSADDGAAFDGLSLAEEAARRLYEGVSDEEKAVLPRYADESWIELYHHLLMLRARLTFDQLVGDYVEYRGGGKASVQAKLTRDDCSQAICGNHIMRAGKHLATFTSSSGFKAYQTVGVIRPLPGWKTRGLDWFSPDFSRFYEDLLRERTDRWEGDVHYCRLNMNSGHCHWSDWTGEYAKFSHWEGRDDYDRNCNALGMLLYLDDGTLSLYRNGKKLGTLKYGLAGEYCWIAGFMDRGDVSIQRGYGNIM